MKQFLFGLVLTLFACITNAGIGKYSNNKISNIFFYTTFGEGDVIVKGSNMGAAGTPCADGFWLSANDPGFQSTLSALLSAYHAGVDVTIYANNVDSVGINRWAGSTGWYCRIDAMGYKD